MKNLILLTTFFFMALFLSCGTGELDFLEGLPDKESLKIKFPKKGTALTGEGDIVLKTDVGDIAEYYVLTRRFTEVVNGSIYYLLSLAEDIAKSPGGKRDGDTKVWGPYTPGGLDPLTYRFTLTLSEKGKWNYKLEAHNKDSEDFKVIFSGEHIKGTRYRRGTGSLMVDFTTIKALDPSKVEEGKIEAIYNTENAPYSLDVTFNDFVGRDISGTVNSVYKYRAEDDGAGEFSYDAQADIDSKGKIENLKLLSRWKSDGSGRCDGRAEGGDIESQGIKEIDLSECWDSDFRRVYYESFINSQSYEKQGDATKCAFSDIKLP
ncbi:MAG: hypothetical protein ACP5KG_03915 [Myxococcota bacterium]